MEDTTKHKDEVDGGYAWIVCFCCFLGVAISEGVGQAYGVLIPDIANQLGSDMAPAVLAGSLHMGVCSIPAPLFVPLIKRFGFRITAVVGALIFAFGLLVCGLVTKNIDMHMNRKHK